MYKFKEELIQAVKILLLSFVSIAVYGQETIKGKFVINTPTNRGGSYFQFNEGNRFKSEIIQSINHIAKNEGYYLIKKDTLILFYEGSKKSDISYYKVTSQTESVKRDESISPSYSYPKNSLSLKVRVLDFNNEPIKFADVLARKESTTLFGKSVDDEGFTHLSTEGFFVDYFQVMAIGYKTLKINAEDFWGKKSEIEVYMNNSPYYYNKEPKIQKILITRDKKGRVSSILVGNNSVYERE